jgi:cell division protein FtsI/penicillin-binding protein 2
VTPEQNPTPGPVRRQRRTRLAAGLLVAVMVTGCSGNINLPGKPDTEGAAKAAGRLVAALSAKDVSSITFADGAPNAAKDFTSLIDPLGSAELTAKVTGDPQVDGDSATSTIAMTWRIPGAAKPWRYQVSARFDKIGDNWQPAWSPSIVEPHLVPGAHLVLSRQQAERGEIIDDNGTALVKLRTVERIGIDKTKVTAAKAAKSAATLASLLDIDTHDYVKLVKASGPSAFVPAIVFRKGDPRMPSESKITAIDGAVVLEGRAMLAPTKSFAAPILGTVGEATAEIVDKSGGTIAPGDQVGLSGLELRYDKKLSGTPDISVSVVPPKSSGGAAASASPSAPATPSSSSSAPITHTTRVFHQQAVAGKDLKITLDRDLQDAAETILADSDPASALVAIRPSTGAIVAAGVNDAADNQNLATYGQYPPGSTFKIIDSLALIRKGVKPDQAMACPATITVDGRHFKNYNDYPSSKLGDVDFRTAFANSCNTAFIGQRHTVDSDDLNAAAASLGFGTDYDVGFPAYFGSIPKPESETERAAEMIGQGRVLGSPIAMATVVASVQAGHTVVPHLVHGVTAKPKGAPLTAGEAEQLRSLMHSVVTEGSGAALQSLQPPSVIAKTGTAEYGTDTPPKTHAWMVAARDDLAVAVFVNDGDSGSGVAGPLLKRFLMQG